MNENYEDITNYLVMKLIEFSGDPTLVSQLTLTTNLPNAGLNSIALIKLTVEIEQDYAIVFEDEEMLEEQFATIAQIADMIMNKLSVGA